MTTSLNIKTRHLLPYELALLPETIASQKFNPDLNHTVALVSGYDGYHEHLVKVDSTGALHVNTAAGGFTRYVVNTVTVDSTTPSSATITLPDYISELDLSISGNSVKLAMQSSLNGVWLDPIQLPVSNANLKFVTNALELWCAVSGSTSTVQVVGWW